ncbi:hypothetical protein J2W91_005400 [Paenibacillus amylolyticus]|uniref:Uncharacterized protein n=1 Tax=Paenibacillus amylolyticus TaxID=1451 RepID=A0AAP5LRN8_PAEAM|nr:hypothetical protein [Paenibacillus amylolyticus]MDR6726875.1 hypothetical protein [Paenibacillus amylolyticus]
MKKVAVVSLYFLSEEEGGQKSLITGDFSTPIVFDLDKELKYGLWSVVVELHVQPNECRNAEANLYFLCHDSSEAPNHLLEPENSFSLRTNKTIAKGKIEYIKNE